jgi:hypothetical protein
MLFPLGFEEVQRVILAERLVTTPAGCPSVRPDEWIAIPNSIVPAATPRSIVVPRFIGFSLGSSLMKKSVCGTNSSVLLLHPLSIK